MTPFEFVIPERPVSQQTRRQGRLREWKERVAAYASKAVVEPREPAQGPVAVRLLYLYDETALDADNIVKPIQDALIGIIFSDDSVVTDVEIRRRWLRTAFTVGRVSPALAAGLELGSDFVYVAIEDAPPQDTLP